jgi:AcrR family transcriptional regulator
MNEKNIHSIRMGATELLDKKAEIFKAGRELFLLKGFKDINVSDITKQAGVSVGTFYNYYPSKEKLFAEIYFKENEKAKKEIMESIDRNDEPTRIVAKFMSRLTDTLKSNLVLKEWYGRDVIGELEQSYRERKEKNDCFVYDFFKELLNKWRMEEKIRNDIDDAHIFALFDSLIYLDTHKKEVGIDHCPETLHLLAEFIMKGLANG